jgi:branched-chain amino acid transport system ATP-binding protein
MLDEPASGLDNRETDNLVALLRELHSDGISLLLIEHDVKMVTSVCDYIFVLDRGKPIASGPPERISRDPLVIKAYLGQEPAGVKEVVT